LPETISLWWWTLKYAHFKDFMPSLRELRHKGGQFQKAATEVQALLGRITIGQDDPFKGLNFTHHGEHRINKCWKYDLNGYARLITIRDNGIVLFCFAGSHEDCDDWLNRNRGRTLIADEHEQLSTVQMSLVDGDPETRPTGPSALTKGKLYESLPEDYFKRLIDGVPRKVVRQLEDVESIHDEEYIYDITKKIDDTARALAAYEVFVLLRQDKHQETLDRLKLFLGETRVAGELTEEEIAALADSEPSRHSRPTIRFSNMCSSTSCNRPPIWIGCCFCTPIRKPW
jgi:hypothetical protein